MAAATTQGERRYADCFQDAGASARVTGKWRTHGRGKIVEDAAWLCGAATSLSLADCACRCANDAVLLVRAFREPAADSANPRNITVILHASHTTFIASRYSFNRPLFVIVV